MNMKKVVSLAIGLSVLVVNSVDGQVGKFLKNVKNAAVQEVLGSKEKNTAKTDAEPPSACEDAELIVEIGKYKIDYSELNIAVLPDGRILLYDRMSDSYYISKGGSVEGPMKENDQRVREFRYLVYYNDERLPPEEKYARFIKPQGEKFVISFGGKTYGPYAKVTSFIITSQEDKFAAMVVENIPVSDSEGKKMDAAIENAKTDAEKMQLAMQYAQLMQERIAAGGGAQSIMPSLVTNVPGAAVGDATLMTSVLKADMKYNEILMITGTAVNDLSGKTLMNLDYGTLNASKTFLSSDNRLYATYNYGTLAISDGRKIQELFNPRLVSVNNKVYLAYMYFSPKRNAIMQCRIPF